MVSDREEVTTVKGGNRAFIIISLTKNKNHSNGARQMELELDEQDMRVAKILGKADADVSGKTLKKYFKYLTEKLTASFELTGSENFSWEEPYIWGTRSQREYDRMKEAHASYKDKFELINLLDPDDADDDTYGLMARVRRIKDAKNFTLPLCDLGAANEKAKYFQLLDDYSYWFVNNR